MKPAAKIDDSERNRLGELPHNPEEDAEAVTGSVERWESPIPFGARDVPGFPIALFPSPLQEYVAAVAEATQVPVDMPAVLALAVVAACIQRLVVVAVKGDYIEPLALYVAAVAEPGTRKSAVLSALTAPIEKWEKGEADRLRSTIEKGRIERAIKEKRRVRLEDEAAKTKDHGKAVERGNQASELAAELAGEPALLAYPRVLADDVTPEQLARLMSEQGERLAVFSAEGGIFETMAGRYSQGVPNIDVFLKGHAGDSVRVDRRNGAPVVMHSPALTMGLAVQPDVMRALVDKPGFRGRGLLARFLYTLPPSLLGRRRQDTAAVPDGVREAYRDCILRLLQVTPAIDGSPVVLTMSTAARAELLAFSKRLEPRLGPGGDLGHIADWAGKAAGAAVRIAGLTHAVRYAGQCAAFNVAIEGHTMKAAVAIVEEYFIPHAVAAFSEMGADAEVAAAQALMTWLSARGLDKVSVRDAHDNLRGQVRFRRADAVERAFMLAERHGYLHRLPDPPKTGPGRRPSPCYAVCSTPADYQQYPQNPRNRTAEGNSADIAGFVGMGESAHEDRK